MWTLGVVDGKVIYAPIFHTISQALNNRYVVNGCEPTKSGLSITIGAGQVSYEGVVYDVGQTTISIAQPATDEAVLVVWDYNNGNPTVHELISTSTYTYNGREYVKAPIIGDQQIPLALAIVRAAATDIADSDFYDVRLGVKISGGSGGDGLTNPVDANLLPSEDDTYSLGDSTHRWKDAYLSGTLWVGNIKMDNPLVIDL